MRGFFVGILLSALLAFAAFAPACGGGGGDELTLEEYFAALQQLDDDFAEASAELDAQLEGLSEEEVLDALPGVFGEQIDNVNTFIDGLDDLDAPDEAQDLQDEAVSAGREVSDLFETLAGELENVETVEELDTLFSDEAFNTAVERFDQACVDAETLAAENDITIDLDCEE